MGTKITNLPLATFVTGSDLMVIVQDGTTKKAPRSLILSGASGGGSNVASDITVDSSGFVVLSGSNVQSVFESADTNFGSVQSSIGVLTSSVDSLSSSFVVLSGAVQSNTSAIASLSSSVALDLADKITGPLSGSDNAIVRFDGTTGKLAQDSQVLISDSGQMQHVAGSAGTPSISFAGAPTAGVFLYGGNYPSIAVAGSQRWIFQNDQLRAVGTKQLAQDTANTGLGIYGFQTTGNISAGVSFANGTAGTTPFSGNSGTQRGIDHLYILSQSSTAGFSALRTNLTYTVTGSGNYYFHEYQDGGTTIAGITAGSNGGRMLVQSGSVATPGYGWMNRAGGLFSSNTITAGLALDQLSSHIQFTRVTGHVYSIDQAGSSSGGIGMRAIVTGGSTFLQSRLTNQAGPGLDISQVSAGAFVGSNTEQVQVGVTAVLNQTSTAGFIQLKLNQTQTALGSGTQRFLSAQIGGVEQVGIDSSGNIVMSGSQTVDGRDISADGIMTDQMWGNLLNPNSGKYRLLERAIFGGAIPTSMAAGVTGAGSLAQMNTAAGSRMGSLLLRAGSDTNGAASFRRFVNDMYGALLDSLYITAVVTAPDVLSNGTDTYKYTVLSIGGNIGAAQVLAFRYDQAVSSNWLFCTIDSSDNIVTSVDTGTPVVAGKHYRLGYKWLSTGVATGYVGTSSIGTISSVSFSAQYLWWGVLQKSAGTAIRNAGLRDLFAAAVLTDATAALDHPPGPAWP